MPGSLRLRIALAYIVLIALSLFGLGLYLNRTEQARLRHRIELELTAEARLAGDAVAPLLAQGAGIDQVDPLVKRMGAEADARITIIRTDGVVLGDSENDPYTLENHGTRPEVMAALASGSGKSTRFSATEHRDFTYLAAPIQVDGNTLGVARVARPTSQVSTSLTAITRTILAASAVAGVLAALLALVVVGAGLRPLGRLRVAAESLGRGRLATRVAPERGELAPVAAAFNTMAGRLQALVADLSEERQRLEALLESLDEGVVALDGQAMVAYLNSSAERVLQVDRAAALGRPVLEVVRDHDLARLVDECLAQAEQRTEVVVFGLRQVWLQATAMPIEGGGEWAGLLMLHDLTDVRRLEAVRRDFVSNVSHELRTPLAALKASAETLRDGALADPHAAPEFLANIETEVDRLGQLVAELLELSRIESGEAPMHVAPLDLRAVAEASVQRFAVQAERAGIELRLEVPEQPVEAEADGERLGRALDNLVHNAIKFTPRGGWIVVEAGGDGAPRLAVSDNGRGIAPEDLPRIFERFYKADRSRQTAGTGLGLAIVKHIVQAHGGQVEVESRPGKGARFVMTLPRPAERTA